MGYVHTRLALILTVTRSASTTARSGGWCEHARITLVDGLYFLEDLMRRNDVLLNGEKTQSAQMKSGDKLTMQCFQLEFVADEE